MVANIASWMDTMHLKLNPDKTEFIMFGYRNQLVKCTTSYVTISDSTIQYLTKDACTTLVLGLCISHLDYANALYYGLPNKTISHLQIIQTMCAKLTLKKSKYDSTRESLAQLHWLLIKQRINFKIATITHKCLYGTAPHYLKDLLIPAPTPRSLTSSNDKTRLIIPFTKCKTFAMQSFSISAPSVWNQLLMSV